MAEYIEKIDELTRQYNDAINALEDSYNMESSQVSGLQILTSSKLKHQYSKKYEELAKEYLGKRKEIFEEYKKNNPEWTKNRKIWGWMFIIGIICAMVCCGASLPSSEEPASAVASQAVSNNQEATLWNAENIPIPYLQDSTQYVSNPDYVLKQETVDKMNVTLKRLENELGVQSVVGVGYGNKGLVVVVGYQDHSINISPGRALEADLTDAECHRLEQEYVVPAMRAEMPDSAMYYLTEAIYSTLQKKELPQMSNLLGDSGEDDGLGTIGLTTLAIIAWCVFFLRKNREYHWLGMAGAASLLANPFYEASHSSGGGGFGGFSGGGGHFGGGGGGGHFGGGSFGGGGATSIMKLSKSTIGIIAAVVVVVMWAASAYNSMVGEQEKATTAFANVQSAYQRRADLIPNLVEVVKGYASHEKETFEAVVNARAKATQMTIDPSNMTPEKMKEFQQAQGELGSALGRLLAVQENYPELKANENFRDLQVQLEGTENRINEARNTFNGVVQNYNTYIRKFPKNIIAGIFGFNTMDKFQADADAQNAPKVKF